MRDLFVSSKGQKLQIQTFDYTILLVATWRELWGFSGMWALLRDQKTTSGITLMYPHLRKTRTGDLTFCFKPMQNLLSKRFLKALSKVLVLPKHSKNKPLWRVCCFFPQHLLSFQVGSVDFTASYHGPHQRAQYWREVAWGSYHPASSLFPAWDVYYKWSSLEVQWLLWGDAFREMRGFLFANGVIGSNFRGLQRGPGDQ